MERTYEGRCGYTVARTRHPSLSSLDTGKKKMAIGDKNHYYCHLRPWPFYTNMVQICVACFRQAILREQHVEAMNALHSLYFS